MIKQYRCLNQRILLLKNQKGKHSLSLTLIINRQDHEKTY